MPDRERVLVTGGSGFLGAHTIVQLLESGYEVRTTVRSTARADEVRAMLGRAGADGDRLLSCTGGPRIKIKYKVKPKPKPKTKRKRKH